MSESKTRPDCVQKERFLPVNERSQQRAFCDQYRRESETVARCATHGRSQDVNLQELGGE